MKTHIQGACPIQLIAQGKAGSRAKASVILISYNLNNVSFAKPYASELACWDYYTNAELNVAEQFSGCKRDRHGVVATASTKISTAARPSHAFTLQ
jgi:hypothetical protein